MHADLGALGHAAVQTQDRGAVEFIRPTEAQQRVGDATASTMVVTGPPASGKTTALAAYAIACRQRGVNPLIIVSHESGCISFRDALRSLRVDAAEFRVDTLAEHAATWMRGAYASAGVAPNLAVGGETATRHILEEAARGLLDMTWPVFARSDINLDLPHLSRPDAFLDEVASLFTLLQRARIGPEEFEEGCAAGLAAFYGEHTERAVTLLADPLVRERASGRGREACRASIETISAQRKAERDLAVILAQLYREYQRAAAGSSIRSAEDLVDAALRWITQDAGAARSIAAAVDACIVDDAEDAEPGLGALLQALRSERSFPLVLAGYEGARVGGFEGRRSALSSFPDATRIELSPLVAPAKQAIQRFADETAEALWISQQIGDLLRAGSSPERIAVLSRNDDSARVYAELLRAAGIPAVMPQSMLERPKEIADLIALTVLLDDPLNQERLLRVLSSPLVGLSDASLWTLCRDASARQQLSLEVGADGDAPRPVASPQPGTLARNFLDGSADALLPEATATVLGAFRTDLARWRSQCRAMSPLQKFVFLAEAAGFRDRWHAQPAHERERLLDDLRRVAEAVSRAASESQSEDFGAIAQLIEDQVMPLGVAARTASAVVVDSIVAVKGLRFDHVFVAGVAHERFPRIYTSHAMAFSRTYGLIVRENVARGAAQTAKFAWYYAKFGAKTMYLDEERRALGYGMSRARSSATATGFGMPPRWAKEHDLLAGLENGLGGEGRST